MKTAILTIFFCVFLCAQIGCSGDTSSNQADANTDSAPVNEFTDANAALAEGSRLLETGETDKAIDMLNQAVMLNPDLAEAYFKLGIAYALVETRDESAEVVEEPTPTPKDKKPKEVKTNSEIAFEKAVEAYKKMLKANPDDAVAQFDLGRAYNKLNEDEDAAKALREAVRLKPDDTEYQTELGAILIKLARYHEALGPLKKALELDPDNSRAQDLLEDAEAGRKRISFTTVKKDGNNNTNTAKPGDAGNSNTKPGDSNTKPVKPADDKDKKPAPPANKPELGRSCVNLKYTRCPASVST
jgi:tetratricopeptide (TPR) repeat protein